MSGRRRDEDTKRISLNAAEAEFMLARDRWERSADSGLLAVPWADINIVHAWLCNELALACDHHIRLKRDDFAFVIAALSSAAAAVLRGERER